MTYVDGFVLVVKKKNISTYKKMAQDGGKLWKKHGALEYLECVGDDLNPSGPMKILTFPKMTKTKSDETVVFSFITYKSRKHRDEVNKRVIKDMMNDPKNKNMKMPFDMKKMAYGGFNVIVEF
jgi:alkaline phosphatase